MSGPKKARVLLRVEVDRDGKHQQVTTNKYRQNLLKQAGKLPFEGNREWKLNRRLTKPTLGESLQKGGINERKSSRILEPLSR